MKAIQLPESFYKGLICKVHVSLNGKTATKELKVCGVKARSITFMEVDRANRQNIFRKVDRKDIVGFSPTAICEITVRDGILPVKWESSWDAIGTNPTPSYARPHYSNHSKGWAATIKAPMGSSIDALAANPPWKKSTTNSAAGFPMV
jgi:hypothetical protein